MKKIFTFTIFLSLLIFVYVNFFPLYKDVYLNYFQESPCSSKVTYTLGNIDPRFGLSKPEVEKILLKSEDHWENALSQDLFEFSPSGKIQVNFVYDERQAATNRLKKLNLKIDNTKASYDKLKTYYESKENEYNRRLKNYQQNLADFEITQKAYETEIAYWNSKNGAPEPVFQKLERTKNNLNFRANELEIERQEVNNLVADLNLSADLLNRTAKTLNLNVDEYNSTSISRGEEFQEGAYIEDKDTKKIEIYQFQNLEELTQVLTHELGHALGLDHVADPKAVMYHLNNKENSAINASDIAEFNRVCKK